MSIDSFLPTRESNKLGQKHDSSNHFRLEPCAFGKSQVFQLNQQKQQNILFSKRYAESTWCLDELVEIKKCIETEKLNAVIPIFLKVEASSVREQTRKFGEKFLALQDSLLAEEINKKKIKRINSRIRRWKKALRIVADMVGLTYDNDSPVLAFVERVVEKVNKNLANIAAEEGRNSSLETREASPGRKPDQIIYNLHQVSINIQLHRSKSFETLRLSNTPEAHNESIGLKFLSPTLRRTASYLDHRDQYGPFPFEAVMIKKQEENQQSIANIVPKKIERWHNLHSVLRYCLELCLCLTLCGAKDDSKESRN